jgi:hypothetical protein
MTSGALQDTFVIAPHMIDATDKAEANKVVWESSWRTGGPSRAPQGLSSFDFVDEILPQACEEDRLSEHGRDRCGRPLGGRAVRESI